MIVFFYDNNQIAPVDAPWRNWGTDGDSIGAGREYGQHWTGSET